MISQSLNITVRGDRSYHQKSNRRVDSAVLSNNIVFLDVYNTRPGFLEIREQLMDGLNPSTGSRDATSTRTGPRAEIEREYP